MNGIWSLVYEGFDPRKEGLREALCTLGNGRFATRGAAPENDADEIHYPGTYLAGGYNRLKSEIAGRVVENEDLVNMPDWLPLKFRIAGGQWFNPLAVEMLEYRQELDMRRGVLHRAFRFRDRENRETRVTQRRIVHMRHPHLAALETTVEAENWSGEIEFLSALDATVINAGVARYRALNGKHLEPVDEAAFGGDSVYLEARTNQSGIVVAQAARTRVFRNGEQLDAKRAVDREPGCIGQRFTVALERGAAVTVEKVVTFFTSGDAAISEPGLAARTWLERAGCFGELLESHVAAWDELWNRFDIRIEEKPAAAGYDSAAILRLHIFHLLQTASMHTIDLDVGVPARGWHGEAYRGHIFWDELFIFPLLNLHVPQITRALLLYRYRRLPEARANAAREGFRGAMFPWQSGSDGREETQVVHLNPKSGRWLPDHTHRQRHVNAAIAYNIWQYHQITRDNEFLAMYGAEMLFEIARFWSSIATLNERTGRYEILGAIGPDEYHDSYPGRESPGIDNNAYTNVMAVWCLDRALETLGYIPLDRRAELWRALRLSDGEIDRWRDIGRRMTVPFHDGGIISQFEGYGELEEFDWEGYRAKYGNIMRLDRILEAEGDTPNRYKASKQADVLMLFYLLSADELKRLFDQLGYPFERETIPRNVAYYLKRASHGSTLSGVVHSWVLARSDRPRSWRLFREALMSDVADVQGGTTPEGIHLGAMAATVDMVQRGMTGLVAAEDVLWLNPCLPDEWSRVVLRLRYREHLLELEIEPHRLKVDCITGGTSPVRIGVDKTKDVRPVRQGESLEFEIGAPCERQ
jgi:alpha,alpha-trehalase